MNLADKIKAVRREKGITPTMMSKELGIEATNYPRLENRGDRLSYDNLVAITKALGITVVDLLTWGETDVLKTSNQQFIDRIKELEGENERLKGQLKDKEIINDYKDKHIRELAADVTKFTIQSQNIFREIVSNHAVKLGLVNKEENPHEVNRHYETWGKGKILTILRQALENKDFPIFSMINNDIYIDHPYFVEAFSDLQKELRVQGKHWTDFMIME